MFDPNRAQSGDIVTVENALIVPYGEGAAPGIARRAGVFDQDGKAVAAGQCWRNSQLPTTLPPEGPLPEPEQRFDGIWVFGGLLYQHFGHALLESTGRLWARQHVPEAHGMLFLTKKQRKRPSRFVDPMMPMLTMFGGDLGTVGAVQNPALVEKLVVPPQGFGTGDMVAGSPELRQHFGQMLANQVAPDGAEKVYISRRNLYSKRGRYFGEAQIEALMAAEGYHIFHPQAHTLEEQAAQYAAARIIVSSDSSALHFAAFFVRPECRLAIILRRPGPAIYDFITQYKWFSQVKPDIFNAQTGRYFQFSSAKLAQFSELYSVLNLPALGRLLAQHHYIKNPSAWLALSEEAIMAERASLSDRLGLEIVPSPLSRA